MNVINAIFAKQVNDLPKNFSVSLLYVLYPVMAFVMSKLIGDAVVYASLFSAMFVGSTPMIAIANTVAEDSENKSLRFLVMAGVKPWEYLFGLSGFVFLMSLIPLAILAFVGEFRGTLLINFIIVAVLGCLASSILGAAIGIFSKNVQQAAAIYTPFMMIMAFLPIFSIANDTLARIAEFLFPYQIIMVVMYANTDMFRALLVILANIVALMAFFIVAYKKKGLRG